MKIYGTGKTLRDTLFIDNLIEGLVLIAEKHKEPFSIVNIGGIGISILEFANAVQTIMPEAGIAYQTLPEHLRNIQVGDVILDNSKAIGEYQWTPKLDLLEAVRSTIEFYKANKKYYL